MCDGEGGSKKLVNQGIQQQFVGYVKVVRIRERSILAVVSCYQVTLIKVVVVCVL